MFHSFHGLMNSINWPASSVWVFIAQLVEHCSANAEATGSNLVEAPKNFFFGLLRNCLNCDSTAMVTCSFHLYSRSSHHFILYWDTCCTVVASIAIRNSQLTKAEDSGLEISHLFVLLFGCPFVARKNNIRIKDT